MSGRPFRCQVRLNLSDLDRNVYGERTIILAQHPDEPDQHILLRFLMWVFFFDDRLEDGGGWTDKARPDVIGTNLVGTVQFWGEAGAPPIKRITRALNHHKDARVAVLFADDEEADSFAHALRSAKPRNPGRIERFRVSEQLMTDLERIGNRNMQWDATITEGELYLQCDGESLSGSLQALA